MIGWNTAADPMFPEGLHNVPTHSDGGDIDDNGHWLGEDMCCLACRETRPMKIGPTSTYLLAELYCGECGEPFARYWQ